MVPAAAVGGPRPARCLIWVVAPWLLLVAFDVVTRFWGTSEHPPQLPLLAPQSPYPALKDDYVQSLGDLTRMAGLPYYDRLFAADEPGLTWRVTDESGYLNAPNGEGRSVARDITLIGASFMTAALSPEILMSQQLARASGMTVYNAAWPGRGPTYAALRLIDQPDFGADRERIVVWGIVQRLLFEDSFRELSARLDQSGNAVTLPLRMRAQNSLRLLLRWNGRLERYLRRSSDIDDLFRWCAPYLPPSTFDRGVSSTVKLGQVGAPLNRPMLFLGQTLQSVPAPYAERGGDAICAAIEKFHKYCQQRGVRLIVFLIPDKYQLYGPATEMLNASTLPREPGTEVTPTTTVFAEELNTLGVETLDLYDPMRNAQLATTTPLFLVDDTHWSQAGIEVAARYIAGYLGGR